MIEDLVRKRLDELKRCYDSIEVYKLVRQVRGLLILDPNLASEEEVVKNLIPEDAAL